MREVVETVGVCPIGRVIRRTYIDRFGFLAGSKLEKEVDPLFKAWSFFYSNEDPLFSYSNYRARMTEKVVES